jgi:hypothetical protein
METQGKRKGRKNGSVLCDKIMINFQKEGEEIRLVKLHGRLVGAYGNADGSNHWEFYATQQPSDAKTPSALGGGKKESAREVLRRKMSSQRGSSRWISPRGTAMEKWGLVAWGALLGAAIYKNLSHLFGF